MRKQFVSTVTDIFLKDSDVILLLGDIGVYGFSHLASEYPSRALNIGILEQATIGIAAGLSMQGFFPIVHTIAPFIVERSLEQLKIDFGYQRLGGNFVSVGAAYDYASLGPTHHCPADFEVLTSVPGFQIFCPGTPAEFDDIFRAYYKSGSANYYRLSETQHHHPERPEPGRGLLIKEGRKALIIAVGAMLDGALRACEALDVTIIYINAICPFDYELVLERFERIVSGKVIILEPAYEGTTASLLLKYFRNRSVAISSIGVPRKFIDKYGSKAEIDAYLGLDACSIRRKIEEILE